jgi:hypothetical protein
MRPTNTLRTPAKYLPCKDLCQDPGEILSSGQIRRRSLPAIPLHAVPVIARSVVFFDTECGGFYSLHGADRLFTNPKTSHVIAVVNSVARLVSPGDAPIFYFEHGTWDIWHTEESYAEDETAFLRSPRLLAVASSVGARSVKPRFREQRVTEVTLPSPLRGEFNPHNQGDCWKAAGLRGTHCPTGIGHARIAEPKSDFAGDSAVDPPTHVDLGKGKE